MFMNEDFANHKYFYTRKKIEKENGTRINNFKDIVGMIEKQNEGNGRKKVILLDEVPARFLFEDKSTWTRNASAFNAFDFEWHPKSFVVACIRIQLSNILKKSVSVSLSLLMEMTDIQDIKPYLLI